MEHIHINQVFSFWMNNKKVYCKFLSDDIEEKFTLVIKFDFLLFFKKSKKINFVINDDIFNVLGGSIIEYEGNRFVVFDKKQVYKFLR